MKDQLLFISSLLLMACGGNAQNGSPTTAADMKPEVRTSAVQGPMIEFDRKIHDYGTIQKGADGSTSFKVTNIGDAPLMINECLSGCGCTVPHCDRDPIRPGESTDIRVTYDTQRVGRIHRTVTVNSNAANFHSVQLLIQGHVEGEPDADGDGTTH